MALILFTADAAAAPPEKGKTFLSLASARPAHGSFALPPREPVFLPLGERLPEAREKTPEPKELEIDPAQ